MDAPPVRNQWFSSCKISGLYCLLNIYRNFIDSIFFLEFLSVFLYITFNIDFLSPPDFDCAKWYWYWPVFVVCMGHIRVGMFVRSGVIQKLYTHLLSYKLQILTRFLNQAPHQWLWTQMRKPETNESWTEFDHYNNRGLNWWFLFINWLLFKWNHKSWCLGIFWFASRGNTISDRHADTGTIINSQNLRSVSEPSQPLQSLPNDQIPGTKTLFFCP